jgi:hypothetical protein
MELLMPSTSELFTYQEGLDADAQPDAAGGDDADVDVFKPDCGMLTKDEVNGSDDQGFGV